MRKLTRSVARANMLRQGYRQINKKKYAVTRVSLQGIGGSSYEME